MCPGGFAIVFEKLADAVAAEPSSTECLRVAEEMRAEAEEIAALRRLVLEVDPPDPLSYTST